MKNNIVFDLASVYLAFTIHETLGMLAEFRESKETFEHLLIQLKLDSSDMEERIYHISCVEKELDLVNKNIQVLENAIMCHETKIFEKRSLRGGMAVICLN